MSLSHDTKDIMLIFVKKKNKKKTTTTNKQTKTELCSIVHDKNEYTFWNIAETA